MHTFFSLSMHTSELHTQNNEVRLLATTNILQIHVREYAYASVWMCTCMRMHIGIGHAKREEVQVREQKRDRMSPFRGDFLDI